MHAFDEKMQNVVDALISQHEIVEEHYRTEIRAVVGTCRCGAEVQAEGYDDEKLNVAFTRHFAIMSVRMGYSWASLERMVDKG